MSLIKMRLKETWRCGSSSGRIWERVVVMEGTARAKKGLDGGTCLVHSRSKGTSVAEAEIVKAGRLEKRQDR